MKAKLKEYIDTIFADAEHRAPHNKQLSELKEEMLRNLDDKYDDLIASGKSPAAAYNIAIAGVGDISDLLESLILADDDTPVTPAGAKSQNARNLTPEEEETVRRWRGRKAVITSVSVALYILSVVPCLLTEHVMGPVLMFFMIAVATALLIYMGLSKPKFRVDPAWDDDEDGTELSDDPKSDSKRPRRSPVYGAISGALWILTVCAYLFVSFATGRWDITWMMFLITVAIDNIIKAIFDLRR